jgi:hypothetical protein
MTVLHWIDPNTDNEDLAPIESAKRQSKSKRKPWRNGFSNQSVIDDVEDVSCYKSLERILISSVGPRSALELELIHRLASLFWRLRRASTIEIGLLHPQSNHLDRKGRRPIRGTNDLTAAPIATQRRSHIAASMHRSLNASAEPRKQRTFPALTLGEDRRFVARSLVQSFFRLSELDPILLERIGAYETRLWRQTAQVIWLLDALRRPPSVPRRNDRRPKFELLWQHHK